MTYASEFGLVPLTREGDGVANILDTSRHHDEALKAKAEATMRLRAVHTKLTVPPVGVNIKVLLLNHFVELVKALLSCTTSDQLTNAWHEHVKGLNGLAILVGTHVERLEGLREVIDADRAVVDLLGQVAFMLATHVDAPVRFFIELLDLLLTQVLLESGDSLCVANANERSVNNVLQTGLERLVNPLV